jgi:undecaprenyl-diphosphatase
MEDAAGAPAGRHHPRQVPWGRRRLDPGTPRGLWLTLAVLVGLLAACALGVIIQDVTGHEGAALLDPHVTAWAVAHRTGWLTSVLRVVTWLGSTAVIIPLAAIVGLFLVLRHRRWRPLALLAAAIAGAVGLYDLVKPLVGRPRPPPAIWIGHFRGASFPSGHAAQSVAFYTMLAIVLAAGRSRRAKTALWGAAALITAIVGGSRIYLGAHWLTDVLGGYALGACWIAVVITVMLAVRSPPAGPGSGRPG